MPDRRRAPRYVLRTPMLGEAMPMQDATVEQYAGDRLVVIAPSAHKTHDELLVHLPTDHGMRSHHAVVVTSTPLSVDGTMSFRLELRIDDGPCAGPVPEPEGFA